MNRFRAALSVLALGVASGLGTIDLVGIRPDLPAVLIPLLITAVASFGAVLTPPAVLEPGRSRTILAFFGAWLAWSYISALTSADPVLALSTTAAFVATMLSAMGVAAMGAATDRRKTSLMKVMAVALLVHATAALIIAFSVEFDQFPSRLSLVDLEPNHLARLLALACLVAVLWALEQPARRWPPAMLLAGVSLLGLLLTGSRTAPTALVVAGFIGLVAARRWRLLVAGGVIGAITIVGLLASGFDTRIVELTNRSGSELTNLSGGNGRTTLWPEVIKVIDDHPLTGIGLGVDRERMRQLDEESATINWGPQHAHNLVLHLAFTTGWIGAALFLGGLILALGTALLRGDPWVAAIVSFLAFDGISEPVVRIPQPTWALLIAILTLAFVNRPTETAELVGGDVLAARELLADREAAAGDLSDDRSDEAAEDDEFPRVGVGSVAHSFGSPLPFGPVLISATVVLALAVGLVWQEPGEYPLRFRCRGSQPMNAAGLLVDIDAGAGTVTLPNDVVELPREQLVDSTLVFSPGDRGVELPDEIAGILRCGAVREHGLTIEFDIATAGLATEGPGRILSIADGPEWSDIDVHLGQELDGLTLRLRQSSTYRNDATIPGVFTDLETHRIRVTIRSDRVEVEKDGAVIATVLADLKPLKFDEWHPERQVRLGNEVTGDRPFVGTLDWLRIYQGQDVPEDQQPG